ncbi:hypothetical protein EDB83DRAFT_2363460 [Lactarius deliciosus]|nr:hypothetical protein EDB83DRAFT_2363460 [Lactarius deliciosus]
MVTQSLEANVEASYHTPPALRIVFAGSSVPLHNRLFYPVANRYSMAHRMILVCGPDWPRAHYSESPHPTARSPRLETSTLLMVVLPPPMTSQSTSCSFSRLFASPVCGLAWRKGRMRMMVLSGMKVRLIIWLDGSIAPCFFTLELPSEGANATSLLHTLALAVHFAVRSTPTGNRRPCHVRLLPQL